jgi:hypothetical protein
VPTNKIRIHNKKELHKLIGIYRFYLTAELVKVGDDGSSRSKWHINLTNFSTFWH